MIFGGQDGGGSGCSTSGNTEIVDTSTFAVGTLATAGGPPGERYFPQGGYDPTTNQLIISDGNSCSDNDLWTLTNANGSGGAANWSDILSQGGPNQPPVGKWPTAYSPKLNIIFLLEQANTSAAPNLWQLANANGFDSNNNPAIPVWSKTTPAGAPATGSLSALAYDYGSNRLVVQIFQSSSTEYWVIKCQTPPQCASVTFTGSFISGQPADAATQAAWGDFINSLNPSDYAMVTISGSNDPTGRSLFDKVEVPRLAAAMKSGGTENFFVGPSNYWNVGLCNGTVELNQSVTPSVCDCGDIYSVRPQNTNPATLWGGVNSFDCPPEGDQTMTVTFSAACCTAPPPDMVSWWPAENNADDIVSQNNGTLENGAGFGTGEVGQAFSLNGSNQDVFIGDPNSLKMTTGITIDAWINPTSMPGGLAGVLTKWAQDFQLDPNADSYALWVNNDSGTLRLFGGVLLASGSEPTIQGGSIPLNAWSHVAMTYD
ncbi:MAG TPA: LamG-like jellyroll fold domain-containing protein, partial [Candidatus Binatia bacterium]|nr:LamG-like jellyroll fold domain-containing protein [Candidatus Binatia bacterium]